MAKAILIIIGILAGAYAVFGVVHFVRTLSASSDSAYSVANLAASTAPACIGLIVCLLCFQRAFRKPPTE